MSDRFKFRVWDKEIKQYIDYGQWLSCAVEFNFNPFTKEVWCEFDDSQYIVEQCTGLKDKNGKLIYEGDIVRETILDEDSALGREFQQKSAVCFGGGDYPCSFTMKSKRFYKGFALLNYGINTIEIEVIGNIHENPELFEKE